VINRGRRIRRVIRERGFLRDVDVAGHVRRA